MSSFRTTTTLDAWLGTSSEFNPVRRFQKGVLIMTGETPAPTSDGPKSERFRTYIRHRQLEMLSEELWDEFLWGELGAARRDFDTAEWGKNQEQASQVPSQ